jgi:hypothetical protein
MIAKGDRQVTSSKHKLNGAGDGIQTHGLILGKDALYQLSYTRLRALHFGGQAR